jgi:arylsulfatase A-like enzyme
MDVLLLTVDSLRYDALFEGDRARRDLPAIAALADRGTSFTRAVSNAAYTAQSFRSILGGTYPWMYGTEAKGFQPERPHLAEELQAAGYLTGGFHSNPHLAPLFGYDRGFDAYLGREDAAAESRFQRLQTGVRRVVPEDSRTFRSLAWAYKTAGSRLGVQLGGRPYVPGERLNDHVLKWVRGTPTDAPRFLWVHYMDVHNPYYPHPETPGPAVSEREAIRLFHTFTTDPDRATDEDRATLRRLYEGEVRYLDRCIGELLADLDGHLGAETLVVLASDHGDAFGEHGRFFHPGDLHDELVHVPLVVAGPGFDGGGAASVPASNADLMPTLLASAGAHVPDACVGADLLELIAAGAAGDTAVADRLVFAHAQSQATGKAMVTDGRFKLLRDLEAGSDRLYDRMTDPDEQTNLLSPSADGSTAPDRDRETVDAVLPRLRAALDDHVETMRAHGSEGEAMRVDVPDDVAEQLRQLGYTD